MEDILAEDNLAEDNPVLGNQMEDKRLLEGNLEEEERQ